MLKRTRVLVVDDSAFARMAISKLLTVDPAIDIIGVASDGITALEKIKSLRPSVVTLDITMPRMDGLTALRHIMAECPTPVVMVSALTGEQTAATIEALELGAVDFFLKPSRLMRVGIEETPQNLANKVKLAAQVNLTSLKQLPTDRPVRRPAISSSAISSRSPLRRMLVVGSSTGGPRALLHLLPALPGDIPAGILLVQHMPPGFTKSLAARLNDSSQIAVKEAEQGDKVRPGLALLAPGDYHMTVSKSGKVSLNQEPPLHGIRPAVDITMESAARAYGKSTLGVVLTGMGSDGTQGAATIKAHGGTVLAEDASTCAVYGMPKSIVDSGYADGVYPLHEMASKVMQLCGEEHGLPFEG